MLVVRCYSGGDSSCVEWIAHIRLNYPICVAEDHLPCALQHAKIAFSLKAHSRVCLFKDDVASGKRRYIFVKTNWALLQTMCHPSSSGCGRYLVSGDGHDRCLTCLSLRWFSVPCPGASLPGGAWGAYQVVNSTFYCQKLTC